MYMSHDSNAYSTYEMYYTRNLGWAARDNAPPVPTQHSQMFSDEWVDSAGYT